MATAGINSIVRNIENLEILIKLESFKDWILLFPILWQNVKISKCFPKNWPGLVSEKIKAESGHIDHDTHHLPGPGFSSGLSS